MGRLRKFTQTLFNKLKIFFVLIPFLVIIPVIFIYSYYFGHRILEGIMLGGDTPYHLALMDALNRYYPKVPIWFPFAGAGSSIILGYWVFSYYLAIAGSHLTQLTIPQWVRLLEFLTVPVISTEIYIFLWIRFKNQVMATIGALMYPLSSIAWGWVALAGFYSMQMSTMLYIPAFLFFDLYLESELTKSALIIRKRLYLLGFFVSMGLGTLVHGSYIPVFYLGLPLYAIIRSQLMVRASEGRLKSILRSVKVLIILLPLGILAGFFILFPQYKYFSLQPYIPTYGPTDTAYIPWKSFLGFERISSDVGSFYTPLFMSLLVTFFAAIGTLLALLKKKGIFALSLVALFYIFVLSEAKVLAINFSFLRTFILPVANRISSITAVYLTILAAYGLWNLADLPSELIRKYMAKNIKPKPMQIITFIISLVLSILVFVSSLYYFKKKQTYGSAVINGVFNFGYSGYGTLSFDIPFCLFPGLNNELAKKKTCIDYQPKEVIDNADVDFWDPELINAVSNLQMNKETRVSVSPYLGSFTFSFTRHTDASMVSAPSGQSIINIDWLGIHDNTLFLKGDYKPGEVNEVAKWFGTKYSFINKEEDEDALNRYKADSWKDVLNMGGLSVKELVNSPGIINISNKPSLLIIGSQKNKGYITTLQVFIKGALSYDEAIVIEGKENIDDYTLPELKNFSVIVLRGYKYKNKTNAWSLLGNYVKEGGSLFVDTGWQYVDKDWGIVTADGKFTPLDLPEASPVTKTTWGDIGLSWSMGKLSTNLGEGINLDGFGSPSWQNQSWGMAKASKADLRSWAEPVLQVNDNVLIARGNLGKGKVIWSGMNLFSHAFDKQSQEEYKLIENIFNDLLPKGEYETGTYTLDWNYPDKVIINLNKVFSGSYLYFAESYTPYWHAKLVSGSQVIPLTVYKAGPRFMAVRLGNTPNGSELIFEFNMSGIFLFSFGVTIISLVLILLMILDPLIFGQKIGVSFNLISKHKIIANSQKIIRNTVNEEEEY